MSIHAVEVEVRIGADGSATPMRLMWQGSWTNITQVSRRWSDAAGDHYLVMIFPPQVIDLIRTPEGHWQARIPGGSRTVI